MAGPNQYRPGVGSVGQYQMSAKPFLSSSIHVRHTAVTEINFPAVTSFIMIQNNLPTASANIPLLAGFSQAGVVGDDGFKIVINNGETFKADFRVRQVFLAGLGASTTGSVYAGLTGIDSQLSGSKGINYSGSLGIG